MLGTISRVRLAVLGLLAAIPAAAQSSPADYDVANLGFGGVGVIGFGVLPTRSEAAPAVQLRVDLGEIAPSVRIAPSLTYWTSDYRDSELDELGDRVEALCDRGGSPCPGVSLGEVEISDLSLEVDAQYLWTTSLGIEPYAGAGVGVHLVNGSGDLINDTFVEDILDGIAPGVNVHAGLELPLGRAVRIHTELRGTLAGSASWVGAGIGGAWTVGGR